MAFTPELIARLEAATGPDRELDHALDSIGPAHSGRLSYYTRSIDAALALVERVLPGADWDVHFIGALHGCCIWPNKRGNEEHDGHAHTAPLAILLALAKATP